jgi:hypothetical protein
MRLLLMGVLYVGRSVRTIGWGVLYIRRLFGSVMCVGFGLRTFHNGDFPEDRESTLKHGKCHT